MAQQGEQVRAVIWETGVLKLLDQRLLPLQQVYITCDDVVAVADGIRDMVVRGAPAIGVAAGYGVARHEIMYNDFIIVGPEEDSASVAGLQDAGAALAKIAATKAVFVSRGDDSGTHSKEKSIWEQRKFRAIYGVLRRPIGHSFMNLITTLSLKQC